MYARCSRIALYCLIISVCAAFLPSSSVAEDGPKIYAGRNINMVSGTALPNEAGQRVALGGDPYLQRQNEPSIAVSTRNPMHIMAGANDYRTVDMPGLPGESDIPGEKTQQAPGQGDTWLGLYKSFDGGQTWQSTLLPGYPQAQNDQEGLNSPIHGFAAAADPTVRAGANGMFYYSGVAFNRGSGAKSVLFVSRFIDLNNREGAAFKVYKNEDPIKYIGAAVIDSGTAGQFMDKPWMAVDIPRNGAKTVSMSIADVDKDLAGNDVPIMVSQQFACGNVYVAYAAFIGQDPLNPHTKIQVARSTDCGKTWGKPVKLSEGYVLNQGATVAIDPANGDVYVAWQVFKTADQPASVVVAKSTDGGKKFGPAVQIALTQPFNQGTRPDPATPDDSFRLFRTNAFPTLAVDGKGRVYAAWSQRGYWGSDNLEPKDNLPDGSRIVISSSTDGGKTWATPYALETPANPSPGFHIMPSLSYGGGRLTLLFYDFRNDRYPELFNKMLEGVTIDNEDGTTTTPAPIDPSLPPADAPVFEPLPVRHTIDARVAVADAAGSAPAVFSHPSLPVSKYLSTYVSYSQDGETITDIKEVQLQSNQVNLPLFSGGTSPFIGDYIEIAASQLFIPDPANPGKWIYNSDSADASVFHAVWADNRNVMPPPAKITTGYDEDGNGVIEGDELLIQVVERPDWTKYTPPSTSENPVCSADSWPGMRNQDIYSSRITQGLVLGSYGNSKPLNVKRAFSIFVENTIPETLPSPGETYTPSSKYFLLTISAPEGVTASFKNPIEEPLDQEEVVEVFNMARVALTVFAKSTDSAYDRASIMVLAQECDADGAILTGGLQSSLILNPDPANPVPLNVDSNLDPIYDRETHYPEFLTFDCGDFSPLSGAGVISNCDLGALPVERLVIQWPSLVDPANPALLNPALLNTTQNPALLNPALLNPALLNPALLNPALLNPALLNPALLNPALLNPALLNPALLNPALLNPALLNPALLNPALLNQTMLNPALLNPALLNPALLNPALLNPALLNPALLNPALLNPALLNPALLNKAPADTIEGFQALEWIAKSSIFIEGTDLATANPSYMSTATLTDITWNVKNIGNDASSFFFTWYSNLQVAPIQILFYRTYKTPSADLNNCMLNEAGLHYEFLANILDPGSMTHSQLLRAMTFSVAPEDHVYITMRFKDPDGQMGPEGINPQNAQQVGAAVVPEAEPEPVEVGMPVYASTATALSIMPSPAVYNQPATFTANVYAIGGAPAVGSVTFFDGSAPIASGLPLNGSGQAVFTTSALSVGVHVIKAAYSGYDVDPAFFSGSASEAMVLYVNKANQTISFGPLGNKNVGDPQFTVSATASSGLAVSFAAGPSGVCTSSGAYGSAITIVGAGACTVTASQAGDANYNPAPDVSQSFQVIPVGGSVTFSTQPGDATAGAVMPVIQVEVRDASNAVVPGAKVFLTIAAGACPTCAISGQDEELTDALGVATFNNVIMDRGGWDYTLRASLSDPLIYADSESFDVVGFRETASMAGAGYRQNHTAILLPNGKVLIAGGFEYPSGTKESAELYDPTTGTWSATGSMAVARQAHTATLLPNGKVLVAGGWNSSLDTILSSAEIYDPVDGTWTAAGSMTDARDNHTAILLSNGKVLVAGGAGSSAYLSSSEIYDPIAGSWTTTGSMPAARVSHAATLLPNGKVLVAGGWNGSSMTLTAEIYDQALGTWSNTDDMDNARQYPSATLLPNGKALVAGGQGADNWAMSSVELYDPTTGTWSASGSMANRRYNHTLTVLPNGQTLVAGGTGLSGYVSVAELYNPTTGAWSTASSTASARVYHTATLLPNGEILVAGGVGLRSAELFYPNRVHLEFTTQPLNGTAGSALPVVQVRAVDKLGNGIDGVSISMGIVPGTCPTCALSGTTSADTAGGGYATFTNLVLDKGGYDYRLAASSAVYGVMAASGLFDVAGFCETDSMATNRENHTSTLLPNGKVLVAGGGNESGKLASAEIYDPAAGAWSSTGAMTISRSYHSATLLPDGKVLVAGGQDFIDSAEIFDPASGAWSATGDMTIARYSHTATLLHNGKVLVATGWVSSVDEEERTELYDPASGTWSATGYMIAGRNEATATRLPNGKVLVAGGWNDLGLGYVSYAELYDPASGAWSATGDMIAPRMYHTATLLPDGKVLVAGGSNGSGSLTSAELYDPATETWSATGAMTVSRTFPDAALLPSGKVLITAAQSSSAELYDPATGTWSVTDSMDVPRLFHSSTILPNGRILVAGGRSLSGDRLSSAELYYPVNPPFPNPGFSYTASVNTARSDHTATLLPNGSVLMAGGHTGTAELYYPKGGAVSDRFEVGSSGTRFDAITFVDADLGYGTNLFYYISTYGGSSHLGTISTTSGSATGHFSVGDNSKALTYVTDNLGYGANLFYYIRYNAFDHLDYFGTISTISEVFQDRIPVGQNLKALTYTADNVGYGANLFYYLRYNAVEDLDYFGTISTSGEVLDKFSVGRNMKALTYVADDLGYGPNLFYYLRQDGTGLSTLGTISTSGAVIDRFSLGNGFDSLAFTADNLGYGANLFYYLRFDILGTTTFGTVSSPSTNGAFVYTDSMSQRSGHTATLLPNGKVLMAGGTDATIAELYDSRTGAFTDGPSMAEWRLGATATLLPNGKVLVSGGQNSGGYLSSAELYDPNSGASGAWDSAGSMTDARYRHTSTLLPNGLVLVAGGSNSGGYLSSAQLYDPQTPAWRLPILLMSSARMGHIAILLPNGLVLVAGGYTSAAELYNPQTNSFSPTGSMNVARADFSATLLPNGKVLIVGGNPSDNRAEIYDPASGSFSLVADINIQRYFNTTTLLPDGSVLISGGNDSTYDLSYSELYRPGH